MNNQLIKKNNTIQSKKTDDLIPFHTLIHDKEKNEKGLLCSVANTASANCPVIRSESAAFFNRLWQTTWNSDYLDHNGPLHREEEVNGQEVGGPWSQRVWGRGINTASFYSFASCTDRLMSQVKRQAHLHSATVVYHTVTQIL